LKVSDRVGGFNSKAILRWRLKPGNWIVDADAKLIQLDGFSLAISSTMNVRRFELVEGWESRYYLKKDTDTCS